MLNYLRKFHLCRMNHCQRKKKVSQVARNRKHISAKFFGRTFQIFLREQKKIPVVGSRTDFIVELRRGIEKF